MKRYGDPQADVGDRLRFPESFLSRLTITADGCVEFTGHLGHGGYGRMRVNGQYVLTHRLAYEMFVGPIPDGLTLDHLCRNPACCYPLHLEPVTNAENVRRALALRWAA